jgi:hypothetical protein
VTCEILGGAIFLHVPKTGGMWVYDTLQELGFVRGPVGRHPHTAFERAVLFPNEKRRWKEWSRAENWRPENWLRPGRYMKLPFTFCFVRHPIRWYESWWRYLLGKRETLWWMENAINSERYLKRWGYFSVPAAAFCDDFNRFVRNVHTRFPGYVTWMYGQYTMPEVNFIGKQERLTEDLIAVLKQLNLSFDEERVRSHKRINESKLEKAAIHWDPGLLREVQAAEQSGLIRYGYEPVETAGRDESAQAGSAPAAV